jgi:pyruvate/2-oxoglutarate dehydrogenase complex dihydrolipoamide acyltransferase (E2) component
MKYLAALALSVLVAVVISATASAAPSPVLLGTADQFALLAGSGFTNSLVTTVTGDVGSSANPVQTGFGACPAANCVTLTGTNHIAASPNDSTTVTAKADFTTAYGLAGLQTSTPVPAGLGGTTKTAGVYSPLGGANFDLTGTLVLDGANNADSLFIFQTPALTTASASAVTFIRGAQACNVYWIIGSAATLGSNSDFSGSVLAHDDISLGDGVTVHGRLLAGGQGSGAGATTLIHDTIIRPGCTTQASIDAATAAAATAAAAAAAAAQAALDAQVQAARAAEAARIADAKAASDAADKAAAAAAAAVKAAAIAAAAVEKAAADAAAAATAKAAAVKAAKAARIAKAAATRARIAKAKAIRVAIKLKRQAIRAPHAGSGFTG